MTKADAIRAELEALKGKDGLLHARDVVQWARKHPKSALYSEFEWDDGEAAEAYRLQQARGIIRLVVTIVTEERAPMRAFVSLPSDRVNHGGYRSVQDIVTDDSRRAEMIQDILERLQALRRKYVHVSELLPIWAAIEEETAKHEKKRRAAG